MHKGDSAKPGNKKVIVIGASNGGIETICAILGDLPADFPAPILIVQHIGAYRSFLARIFGQCGCLQVSEALRSEPLLPGHIYVAPPDQHLQVQPGKLFLTRGPRENLARPAINPLFRSASRAYRHNVIGVLLTGDLDDGVAGLFAIQARGGVTIVQDPTDAQAPNLPREAIKHVVVDYVVPAKSISALLQELVQMKRTRKKLARNHRPASRAAETMEQNPMEATQIPAPLVCPDCSGPLYEVKAGKLLQFQCIVGHSYSPMSLTQAHSDALERALWIAIRVMQEKLNLHDRHGDLFAVGRSGKTGARTREQMEVLQRDLELLKQIQEQI